MTSRQFWRLDRAYSREECLLQSPGKLVMSYDSTGQGITITTADPVVWMSDTLLREMHLGTPDFVELECHCIEGVVPEGDVIKITDSDHKRFVYVVRRLVNSDPRVWEVAWPD